MCSTTLRSISATCCFAPPAARNSTNSARRSSRSARPSLFAIARKSGYSARNVECVRARTMADGEQPFWKTKKMSQMTQAEWESLCDGCGKCCLNKIIDTDTNELHFTNVACKLLDTNSCQCKHYKTRHQYVKDCVRLTPRNV